MEGNKIAMMGEGEGRERESNLDWANRQTTRYLRDKNFFNDAIKGRPEANAELNIQSIPEGTIKVGENPYKILDKNLRKVEIQTSGTIQGVYGAIPKSKDTDYIDEEVIFGGVYIADHIGHCIVESLSRCWVYLDEKYKNTKLVLIKIERTDVFDFYSSLGIQKENIILITKNTKFKNILVPDMNFLYPSGLRFCDSNYTLADIFNKIQDNMPDKYSYKKIFLGRKSGNGVIGLTKMENLFRKNGFEVIYPEDYSIEDSISLMKHCEVLASVTGSGLHRSVFMPDGGTVIALTRNKVELGIHAQVAVDRVKRHNTIYINADISPFIFLSERAEQDISFIGMTCYMYDFCNNNSMNYDETDRVSGEEIIKYLIDYSTWMACRFPIRPASESLLFNNVERLSLEDARLSLEDARLSLEDKNIVERLNNIIAKNNLKETAKPDIENKIYRLFGLVPVFKIKIDNKCGKIYWYFCGVKFLKIDKKRISLFGVPLVDRR